LSPFTGKVDDNHNLGMHVRFAFALASILILSILAQTGAPVSAQSTQGEIEIECDTSAVIDVTPGASEPGIAMCEVTNPSEQQETVEISINAGSLNVVSSLDEITLGSGETAYLNLTLWAPEGTSEGQQIVQVGAEVTHIEGTECNDCGDSRFNFLGIVLQYTDFDFIPEEDTLILSPREEKILLINITSHGNAMDRFNVMVDNYDELNDKGFQISLPLVSVEVERNESQSVQVLILPSNSACADGIENNEELIIVSATSEYTLRNDHEIVREETQVMLRVDCLGPHVLFQQSEALLEANSVNMSYYSKICIKDNNPIREMDILQVHTHIVRDGLSSTNSTSSFSSTQVECDGDYSRLYGGIINLNVSNWEGGDRVAIWLQFNDDAGNPNIGIGSIDAPRMVVVRILDEDMDGFLDSEDECPNNPGVLDGTKPDGTRGIGCPIPGYDEPWREGNSDMDNESLPAPSVAFSILAFLVAALRGSKSNI
jgi:hypothetical protein